MKFRLKSSVVNVKYTFPKKFTYSDKCKTQIKNNIFKIQEVFMADIKIKNLYVGHDTREGWQFSPNSAGGVSVQLDFVNLSGKTIKYADFYFIPYNAVGDAVSCRTRRQSERGVQCTGPLENGLWKRGMVFSNAWYNNSIKTVKITKIDIQYIDGSKTEISESEVEFDTSPPPAPASSGGCYVATAVYGSYDCPQVWTLRRYRDNTLNNTWYGRMFIHLYYAVSPTLVKWFGNTNWFKRMWHNKLDKLVAKLQANGVKDTPYKDIFWK
jgi:hypothetical protein